MMRFLRTLRYCTDEYERGYDTVQPNISRRPAVLFLCMIAFGGGILGRLLYLQVIQRDQWVARAAGQQESERSLFAKRGSIYIQDASQPTGVTPIALNRQYFF